MNTVAITGTITSAPRFKIRGFMPATTFDITVHFVRRNYTFTVRTMNATARTARHLTAGAHVSVTGYLHAEPFDMPDGTTWQRIEIVAYDVDTHPAPGTPTAVAP